MKIIFLGAPGAGKGTQADKIAEICSIPTISTGAIIREAIKNGTEMGMAARAYTEKGALVPDEVVIGIIKERLAADDCKNGFILDGFPRTVPQAEALDELGVKIDYVVDIDVDDADIVERMGGRRVCEACGMSYHIKYIPTKDNKTCDKCGAKLIIRKDDQPETVLERLAVYHEKTAPLKDYYEKQGKLVTVEGQEEVSETSKLTLAAVGA
jgi:adenylate kinase